MGIAPSAFSVSPSHDVAGDAVDAVNVDDHIASAKAPLRDVPVDEQAAGLCRDVGSAGGFSRRSLASRF
jgi:hypothetical protein